MSESPSGLEVRNLTKRFGKIIAVNDVSFGIKSGEFFSLLGPSGSGKTTMLRMIGGLETPDAGDIFLEGEKITFLPPEKRDVNIVFQNYALFPHLNVYDNVAFGPRRRKWPEDKIRQEVTHLLEMVHLSGYEEKYPRQLSGGEKQRIALIRALILKPKLLLLDEPLGALDLKIRQSLQLELANIQYEVGITFIYVTHDQSEALTMADRIAVMNKGRILQMGTPKEIYEHPTDRFVANFIGNTNLFEGKVMALHGDEVKVDVPDLMEMWGVASDKHVAHLRPGMQVAVSVRPEKMRISRNKPEKPGHNMIQGMVIDVIYLGVSTEFLVRLPNGQVVRVFAQNISQENELWTITWDEQVWVYWRPYRSLILADAEDAHYETVEG